jgi:hypothetical protein
MNGFMKGFVASIIVVAAGTLAPTLEAQAQSSTYPGIRYINPYSQSMGGVTLPLSQDIGNSLFNNPAGLARNTKFKAEFLNLDLDIGSATLGGISQSMTTLGGLSGTLNSNPNTTYSEGISNLTALSWGGLGVGILYQDRVRAYSDGAASPTAHYSTLNNLVPAAGYGLSLARGVLRVGYSLQYVNEASGVASSVSDTSASFLNGVKQGHGFSHTTSVNLALPITYLPTFSLIGRNIGGLHFSGGNLMSPAKNASGLPTDQPTSIDAAFNFTVRLSGSLKSYWFFEYDDVSNTASLPIFEKMRLGLEILATSAFSVRAGFNGAQVSGGIGFRSESSEINVTYYNDRNPFSNTGYWDTRYALQYKVFFQGTNHRDRNAEEVKGK